MDDVVDVICYGRRQTWNRSEAIQFFLKGMLYCDGSERERYTNVYIDLINGLSVCTDGCPERR